MLLHHRHLRASGRGQADQRATPLLIDLCRGREQEHVHLAVFQGCAGRVHPEDAQAARLNGVDQLVGQRVGILGPGLRQERRKLRLDLIARRPDVEAQEAAEEATWFDESPTP